MTIAVIQTGTIGARNYEVQGPFNATGFLPTANMKFGETAMGDAEAEYVYVNFNPGSAPLTLQQGQLMTWDNNFVASLLSTTNSPRGQSVGAVFLGGRYGDAAPAPFSTTLAVTGSYGLWLQRSGVGLVAAASTAAQGNLANTTATAGQADAPTTATAGSKAIFGLYFPYGSVSFTASTVTGSPTLTLPSSVAGVYPGQAITGTGIPANSFVGSINGIPGGYSISLVNAAGAPVNATATGTAAAMTVNGYLEAYLKRPFINQTN